MKNKLKYLVLFAVLSGLVSYSGCKKDHDDPTPITQIQLSKLIGVWNIESVDLDGEDNTDYYADFALQISGSNPSMFTYATTGQPHYSSWPSSGSFSLATQNALNSIIRDLGTNEELTVIYTVTDTKLTLLFNFNGEPYNSRIDSVVGEWTFVFTKQTSS